MQILVMEVAGLFDPRIGIQDTVPIINYYIILYLKAIIVFKNRFITEFVIIIIITIILHVLVIQLFTILLSEKLCKRIKKSKREKHISKIRLSVGGCP